MGMNDFSVSMALVDYFLDKIKDNLRRCKSFAFSVSFT